VTALPEVISRYQQAHDRHDTDGALSAFARDASVADDGQEYHGTDEIRRWLDTAAREFTYTRTLLGVDAVGADAWDMANRLEGNFPGGTVDLRYRFVLSGGLISELVIAP
jgi:SnoaL-like domain